MVNPFLRARKAGRSRSICIPDSKKCSKVPAVSLFFHEQVLQIVHIVTGCDLPQADEVRRSMGSPEKQKNVDKWFHEQARARGFDEASVARIWEVLRAFASFGFCKAHAAAFALPTYQSAWLKTHHRRRSWPECSPTTRGCTRND